MAKSAKSMFNIKFSNQLEEHSEHPWPTCSLFELLVMDSHW